PLGLLTLEGKTGRWVRALGAWIIPHDALHPYTTDVDAHLVERVHRRGRRIHVWTVNQPEDMRRLFRLGVDGIFTDDPALALHVLGEPVDSIVPVSGG
ncbi:MAG: glycerophosphodiester phosphodiesterase family protein, partial [Anaerolineaceae bacterium]|nr:glycerophosphodiester phosphodiesterase family protein [Anaerolineaceae bacterium]